jgi:hypothetical protein
VDVHLLDGTYELFRHFYAMPSARDAAGARWRRCAASQLGARDDQRGARHVAVATDHVIESFRNGLWAGYKTGAGIDPISWRSFRCSRSSLAAMGVTVWPMVEFEADDALAAAAVEAAADPRVERVVICTPDKDSGAVRPRHAHRAAQSPHAHDHRRSRRRGEVRRTAHLDPRLSRARRRRRRRLSRPARLGRQVHRRGPRPFGHIEDIPPDWRTWGVNATNPAALARTLEENRPQALLFRTLATLRTDVPTFGDVGELEWTGPRPEFAPLAAAFEAAARTAAAAETRPLTSRRYVRLSVPSGRSGSPARRSDRSGVTRPGCSRRRCIPSVRRRPAPVRQ